MKLFLLLLALPVFAQKHSIKWIALIPYYDFSINHTRQQEFKDLTYGRPEVHQLSHDKDIQTRIRNKLGLSFDINLRNARNYNNHLKHFINFDLGSQH